MRILDDDHNLPVHNVLIMLTPQEAKELRDQLLQLIASPDEHIHVPDAEYKREITVAVYTPDNIHSFGQRGQLLIEQEQ